MVTMERACRVTPGSALTKREREVVRLLCQGHSNKGIAEALGLSEFTVHSHIARIMYRTSMNSRFELIAKFGHGSQVTREQLVRFFERQIQANAGLPVHDQAEHMAGNALQVFNIGMKTEL